MRKLVPWVRRRFYEQLFIRTGYQCLDFEDLGFEVFCSALTWFAAKWLARDNQSRCEIVVDGRSYHAELVLGR